MLLRGRVQEFKRRVLSSAMADEDAVYRTAKLLIDQGGALDAEIFAAQCADQYLADDNMKGRQVWLRIMEAVKAISAKDRNSPPAKWHSTPGGAE